LAVSAIFTASEATVAAPYQSRDRISIIVGFEAGGGYDMYGRFVARFLPKYLPGQPSVVVQNMPGASSLLAANHIYNIAPKDGTTIGIVGQDIALMQLLERPGIMFDVDRFYWLGRLSDEDEVLSVRAAARIGSIEDLKSKEIPVAVGGALSGSSLYPIFLNDRLGTKIRSVRGYSVGQQALALERGEIDGSFGLTYSYFKTQHPSWLTNGTVKMLIQIGQQRHESMPDVPTLAELAKTDEDRGILSAISGGDILGRAFIAPPGTDEDRLKELRQAFDAMAKDPEVIKAAQEEKLDLDYMDGAATQALVHQYQELSPSVVTSLKHTVLEAAKGSR
jgi:tripartite-type tricarboxylate transporter receptor subunit TctC